jgi:hypothetical protein
MLSLLDVMPRHEQVDIGAGQPIDVVGISGEDLFRILARYPTAFADLISLASNPATGGGAVDGGVLGALLAASQRSADGHSLLGNAELELRCRTLAIGAQLKLMLAVGRCTFPDGLNPFLRELQLITSAAETTRIVVQTGSKGPASSLRPGARNSGQPVTPASGN